MCYLALIGVLGAFPGTAAASPPAPPGSASKVTKSAVSGDRVVRTKPIGSRGAQEPDPALSALLRDPEVLLLLVTGDLAAAARSAKVRALLTHPRLHTLFQRVAQAPR